VAQAVHVVFDEQVLQFDPQAPHVKPEA